MQLEKYLIESRRRFPTMEAATRKPRVITSCMLP